MIIGALCNAVKMEFTRYLRPIPARVGTLVVGWRHRGQGWAAIVLAVAWARPVLSAGRARSILASGARADILRAGGIREIKLLTLSNFGRETARNPKPMETEYVLATVVASITTAVATYAPHFVALVGLVVMDFVTGVSAAMKQRAFSWARVGDFYRADVGPKVLGWAGTTLGLAIVTPFLPALGEYSATITAIGSYGLYSGAVVSLLASIVKSINEIRA